MTYKGLVIILASAYTTFSLLTHYTKGTLTFLFLEQRPSWLPPQNYFTLIIHSKHHPTSLHILDILWVSVQMWFPSQRLSKVKYLSLLLLSLRPQPCFVFSTIETIVWNHLVQLYVSLFIVFLSLSGMSGIWRHYSFLTLLYPQCLGGCLHLKALNQYLLVKLAERLFSCSLMHLG